MVVVSAIAAIRACSLTALSDVAVSRARSAQFQQSAMRYKGEELTGERLSLNGEGARALNAGLLADDRVLQVMLPLRDGLTLAFRQH